MVNGMKKEPEFTEGRHLTVNQREEISAGVQNSATGPVSITAPSSDTEAVEYEGEIASVLEDMGCEVEIDNARTKESVEEIPKGVEMTIKEETVRPIHASRIVRAFRRAGVVIATRINARRRKTDTLYITVGSNPAVAISPPANPMGGPRRWKSWSALFARH